MTKKISTIYNETLTAVKNLKQNMSFEEKEKILKIIDQNKKYFGLTINVDVMSFEELKNIPILIMDHVEMTKRNRDIISLKILKKKIEEEPEFMERFNF